MEIAPAVPTFVGTPLDNTAYWDAVAPSYDDLYHDPYSEAEDHALYERINATFQSGVVLDVGCGLGLGRSLLDPVVGYIGCDISPEMIRRAQLHWTRQRFDVADACALPYADASMDGLMMLYGVFSFVRDPLQAIFEMNRVLKPGAPILLMGLNRGALWRIRAGQSGWHGLYSTRGSRAGIATDARYYRDTELYNMFVPYFITQIQGFSFFGGWAEDGARWQLDTELCAMLPTYAHSWIVTGAKRGGESDAKGL